MELKTKEGKLKCVYSYQHPDENRPETCSKPLACRICGYCHQHCGNHLGVKDALVKEAKVKES